MGAPATTTAFGDTPDAPLFYAKTLISFMTSAWLAEDQFQRAVVAGSKSPEIAREEKRLQDASHAAFKAVYNFAAATPVDLIAKIEFLKSRDIDIDHDQMLADLRRVFGEA